MRANASLGESGDSNVDVGGHASARARSASSAALSAA